MWVRGHGVGRRAENPGSRRLVDAESIIHGRNGITKFPEHAVEKRNRDETRGCMLCTLCLRLECTLALDVEVS